MKTIRASLLTLIFVAGILLPGTLMIPAHADSSASTSSSGMVIDKTATANDDGTYEITLEAYATGSKIISSTSTEVPTDIVLVLDLSSSMEELMKTYSFSAYSGTNAQNTHLYANRHNGGSSNLWYKLSDGSYVSVSVLRTVGYTLYDASTNNFTYYNNANNLYELVNGEYKPVSLARSESGDWRDPTYTYTYTFSDGTTITSSGANNAPKLNDRRLYAPDTENAKTVYTYSYTKDGATVTICQSTGSSTVVSGYTFYARSSQTSSTSRLLALESAVNGFIDSVYDKATNGGIAHRIAIVGFNTSSTAYTGSNGTLAFVNMNTTGANSTLKNTVSHLSTSTGTKPAEGLNAANSLFSPTSIPEGESRNRVVILFTDGYPSASGPSNFDTTLANAAIASANTAKSTHSATVYTVAILDDADPTMDISSAYSSSESKTLSVNRYLHYVSSNYPNALSLNSGGALNANADPFHNGRSYYLTATDTGSLTSIFQSIASEIESGGSATTLSSSTVIRDIIAPQFQLPEGTTAETITLETYSCTGKDGDDYTWAKNSGSMGAVASVNADDATVNVTGFDFAENYVGTVTNNGTVTYRGHKLVIRFTVRPRDGFLGGNNVYTNTSADVYENDSAAEPVLVFPRPTVNVPIGEITITANNANVYLTQPPTEEQLASGVTIRCGNVDITDPSKLEDWQKAYVTIDNHIQADGRFDATTDGTYTVTAAVTPDTDGNANTPGTIATEQTGSASGSIFVFRPELTFRDSEVYYGASAPTDLTGNLEDKKNRWIHENKESTSVSMTGEAPVLTISYTPESDKIANDKIATKQDIAVDVTVKIGDTDVTGSTAFVHTPCHIGETIPLGKEFLLHVNTCQLTITKMGGAANESYVFDVYKDGEKYTEVTIWGNGRETIYELPVGTYTLQENTGWSWRYNAENSSAAVLSAQTAVGSITCTNTSTTDKWLNGFSTIVQNVFGAAAN